MLPANTTPSGVEAPVSSSLVGQLSLRFGVGAGVACALWFLFLHFSGNNAFGPKQLLGQMLVPMAAAGSQWLLRRKVAPARPGVGRALAVGSLVAVLAATIAAASLWGLAYGVGEPALARNRAEMTEIVRVQQRIRPKAKRNAAFEAEELRQVERMSISNMALGTFTRVLILGMIGAVPAGLFLRK